MAFDFPASPTNGQKYPASPIAGVPNYTWDGEKWTTSGSSLSNIYVSKTGDTMTGHLSLPTAPAAANAVRKDYVDAAVPVAATAAEYRSNSAPAKMLTSGATWGAAAPVALTDGATVTPDFGAGIDFTWTLAAAGRSLLNPTNAKPGQKGLFAISAGASGTITSWGTAYKFPGGTKPTLTLNGTDIISYWVLSAAVVHCSSSGDFK
jgi:hypothetical protein